MEYQKVWEKVLNPDEKVEYEFSFSNKYRKTVLIVWSIVSLLFLLLHWIWLGIFIFLIVLFWWYRVKIANAYAFTDRRVVVHKGWLSTKTTTVDYDKIVEVSVKEPFTERKFYGSGNLYIKTAGNIIHDLTLAHINAPYEVKKRLDQLRNNYLK